MEKIDVGFLTSRITRTESYCLKLHNRVCGGAAPIILSSQSAENGGLPFFEHNILPNFPWLSLKYKSDRIPLLERSILAHAQAQPIKLQGLSTLEKRITTKNSFHIVYYELIKEGNYHIGHDISQNVVPFYGKKDCYLRKSAFTVRISIFSIFDNPTQLRHLFAHFNNSWCKYLWQIRLL